MSVFREGRLSIQGRRQKNIIGGSVDGGHSQSLGRHMPLLYLLWDEAGRSLSVGRPTAPPHTHTTFHPTTFCHFVTTASPMLLPTHACTPLPMPALPTCATYYSYLCTNPTSFSFYTVSPYISCYAILFYIDMDILHLLWTLPLVVALLVGVCDRRRLLNLDLTNPMLRR